MVGNEIELHVLSHLLEFGNATDLIPRTIFPSQRALWALTLRPTTYVCFLLQSLLC